MIKRIESEKDPKNYTFKNEDYLKRRGKINAKAIKNLKQLTVGIEQSTSIPGSCKFEFTFKTIQSSLHLQSNQYRDTVTSQV